MNFFLHPNACVSLVTMGWNTVLRSVLHTWEFNQTQSNQSIIHHKRFLLFHTFSVLCPRKNWRDLYGKSTKFSQANQRTTSYVPDPLVVTKRHKGQQATSWWHPAAFTVVRNRDKKSARQLYYPSYKLIAMHLRSHTKTKRKTSKPRITPNNVTLTPTPLKGLRWATTGLNSEMSLPTHDWSVLDNRAENSHSIRLLQDQRNFNFEGGDFVLTQKFSTYQSPFECRRPAHPLEA